MAEQPKNPDINILWIDEQIYEYYPNDEILAQLFNLTQANYEEEGIEYLKQNRYDLVLLDLMLPKNKEEYDRSLVHLGTGQHILQQLRNQDESEKWATPFDCAVIVFTARGNKDALSQVIKLIGEHGELLQKPVLGDVLIEKVYAVLGIVKEGNS